MIKRIATAVLIVIASLIIGGALVGFNIISSNAGAIFWLVCIVAAIIVFFRSGKKDPKPKI